MSTDENEVAQDTAQKTKAEVESVSMEDGRVVGFAGKRKLVKEGFIGENGDLTVRLDFRNGRVLNIALPTNLVPQFALHGALQKYGDETAGETDVDDMVLGVEKLDKRIQAGEWTQKREGGGMSGTSVLIKALVEFSGKSVEQVKTFLEDKTQAYKIAMRNDDKRRNAAGNSVKDIVTRLEAEKAAKGPAVDTASLLGELEGMEDVATDEATA